MSDGEVDTTCGCDNTSFNSSMISKPQTSSALSSRLFSCTSQTSSSPIMQNFLNYNLPSPTSDDTYYLSFTYFISRSIGLGFLCLPYAFKQVGVITGLALCFIAGLMFTYSFATLVSTQMFLLELPWKAILIKNKMRNGGNKPILFFFLCRLRYKLCQIHRVPTVPYQNLIEYSLACGPRMICRWFSTFLRFTFIATNLTLKFGKSCLYMKFVSLTIYELITEMGFSVNYFNVSLSFGVVCLVLLLLPNGTYLTALNILNNMACTALLSLIGYNIFKLDMDIGSRTLICGNWTDVFQFFGILLFTFIPIIQVFKIEDGSIRKNDIAWLFKLLNTSMIIITNMYIAIGLCGYLDQQDVPIFGIPILKYMPAIRCQTIVKTCVAINVMIFHRELNIESTLLWASSIKLDNVKKLNSSPAIFVGMTAFTKILFTICSFYVSIAVVSPATSGFQVMVSLVGYLGNACNIMVYPYIVEMCITYGLHGISTRRFVILKDVCLVLLGLSVFVCGTSVLVLRIIHGDDWELI
ncbi:hypothetical protein QTP88_013751 [Uroleucon formosanum]